MMVAEREQLGQPAVVRDHDVVIDLDGGRGVVAHLVVHPRIAVVRRVRDGRCGEQVPTVLNVGAPRAQGGEVEVGRLILLYQNDNARHARMANSTSVVSACSRMLNRSLS